MNPTQGHDPLGARHRWVVNFAVTGDLRFLSHRDTLRLFARALSRAKLPVRSSHGFNPRPWLSIPLPRPVGVASDVECLLLELTEDIPANEVGGRLSDQMPPGITIQGAALMTATARYVPQGVDYAVSGPELETPELSRRSAELMESESIPVERDDPKRKTRKRLDIRPYLEHLRVMDGEIHMRLKINGQGTARPSEVCHVLGLSTEGINARIRRTEIQWQ